MKKSLSIALACAVGAGIGTILALQYFGGFWVVGVLIGGLIGYFAYDFETVIKAIPKAWESRQKVYQGFSKKSILRFLTVVIALWPLYCMFLVLHGSTVSIAFGFGGLSFFASAVLINFFVLIDRYASGQNDKTKFWIRRDKIWQLKKMGAFWVEKFLRKKSITTCLILSPFLAFCVPFTFFAKLIARLCKKLFLFFWNLLKIIHSDLRLLVGIDSLVGGCIGWYFQSPIIGMCSGFVWGFFNYHIISLRVFKLKPSH